MPKGGYGQSVMAVNWWNTDSAPTAAEWQAIWMFATLLVAVAAAWVALRQLRQMREANENAARAAESSAAAVRESIRPYVEVSLGLKVLAAGDPTQGNDLTHLKGPGTAGLASRKKVRVVSWLHEQGAIDGGTP